MSTIKVDTIVDEAGTGAPNFSAGATVTGNITATGTIGATGTVTGGAFSGSGAGLTGIPTSAITGFAAAIPDPFNPVAVTGTTPSLDVGSYNFFNQGELTANTTVSFANVPTNAKWSYTFIPAVAGVWDLSNASFVRTLSLAGYDSDPQAIYFKADGKAMYVAGGSTQSVIQFALSTPWDISTLSLVAHTSIVTNTPYPHGLFFKDDGTKMYTCDPGGSGSKVNEYTLSTAWLASTISYSQSFSLTSQDPTPLDLTFKPDGTKMYFSGTDNDSVYGYTLSTAWDISTATHVETFSISTQTSNPYGLFFKTDGTKMYIVDNLTPDSVYEYNLSTAWDVSTASYSKSFSVATQDIDPMGVFFRPDGVYMYVVGKTNGLHQYSFGDPYTVTLPSSLYRGASEVPTGYENVTYDFFTMDGGTTVTLIGEEIV